MKKRARIVYLFDKDDDIKDVPHDAKDADDKISKHAGKRVDVCDGRSQVAAWRCPVYRHARVPSCRQWGVEHKITLVSHVGNRGRVPFFRQWCGQHYITMVPIDGGHGWLGLEQTYLMTANIN